MSLSEKQIKKLEKEDKPRVFIECGLGDSPILFSLNKSRKMLLFGVDNHAQACKIANTHFKQNHEQNAVVLEEQSTDALFSIFTFVEDMLLPCAEERMQTDKRPFNIVIFLDSHCIPVFAGNKIVGWQQSGDCPILKELEIISNFINCIINRANKLPITIITYIDDLRVFKNPEKFNNLYGQVTYDQLESFVQSNLSMCHYSFLDSINGKQDILKLVFKKEVTSAN